MIGLIAISLLAATLGMLFLLTKAEVASSTYESYTEAQAAGALGKGKWLPLWLPITATEIWETHDIDTNESWLHFTFSGTLHELKQQCQKVTREQIMLPSERNLKGFPQFVREALARLQSNPNTEFQFYRCRESDGQERFVAIQLTASTAYSCVMPH